MHIEELKALFAQYVASDPYQIEPVMQDGKAAVQISWVGVDPLSGAILGDAVHNLRAALDITACELARIKTGSDDGVYFPIPKNGDGLEAAIKAKKFDSAGEDAVSLLLSLRGHTDALRALHGLDIADKHRLMLATVKHSNLRASGTYDIDAPLDGTFKVEADTAFLFPDDSALAGKEVVRSLEHLAEMIDGIVEAFAGLLVSRAAN